MRKYGVDGVRPKLLATVMTAALAGACSSDVTRFGDDPFQSPFRSRAAFDPVSTNSVTRQRAPVVPQQSLPPVTSSNVVTQSLPAPSRPMMASAAAPLTTGSVASANYRNLAAGGAGVVGAANGWSAVGGTPITAGQGDTVNSLSSRYGVPVSAIMAVNGLSGSSQVQPGQQLIIPAYSGAAARAAAAPAAATAVIQRPAAAVSSAQSLPQASAQAVSPLAARKFEALKPELPKVDHTKAAAAAGSEVTKVAASPARIVTPIPESEAEKRAAAKLKELKAAKPAPKADDDGDEDDTPAAPKKKAEDVKRLDKEKAEREKAAREKAEAAKEKAEAAKKAADAKAKIEAEKLKAAKIAAAKKAKANEEVETTGSLPDAKPVARASQPLPPKPAEQETASTTTAPAAQTESSDTSFRWPAKGRVISGFGARGTGGANDGINIALPEGTPVRAAEGGTVVHADDALKGYGKLVLIRHPNGYVSVYAHNGELKVKRGETVKRGQVVALSGQSGNVTAPQLHFELRKGATPVDPTRQLSD